MPVVSLEFLADQICSKKLMFFHKGLLPLHLQLRLNYFGTRNIQMRPLNQSNIKTLSV